MVEIKSLYQKPNFFVKSVKEPTIPKRVLILDDEEAVRSLIQESLSLHGYETHLVENVEEAFDTIRSFVPHLVITDCEMPGLTGLELLRELRQQKIHTNVIVMSDRKGSNIMTDAFKAGADDFIHKPFQFQEFLVRIESIFKSNDLRKNLLATNKKLQELVDLDYLTGLYNMRSVYDKIDSALEATKTSLSDTETSQNYTEISQGHIACIMLDLDDFKLVNDRNDHLFGSLVIKQTGEIIAQALQSDSFAARYGGDEFLIVMKKVKSEDEVRVFCEHLRSTIEKYHFKDGLHEATLTVSLGFIVANSQSRMSSKELVRHADHALYDAKEKGKNTIVKFLWDLHEKVPPTVP